VYSDDVRKKNGDNGYHGIPRHAERLSDAEEEASRRVTSAAQKAKLLSASGAERSVSELTRSSSM
jgi:hypothetical protein